MDVFAGILVVHPWSIEALRRHNLGGYLFHRIRPDIGTIAVIVCCLLVPAFLVDGSWAHSVRVFAFVEGDKIVVQGYFGGKTKARDCAVSVFDSSSKKVHEGKTNAEGLYSFKFSELSTAQGDLRVVLEAGEGHRAQYSLRAADLPTAGVKEAQPPKGAQAPQPDKMVGGKTGDKSERPDLNFQQFVETLQEAVRKEIQPLVTMVGNQQKALLELQDRRPTLESVVGGIGWIIGLVGIAAYFMSRTRRGGS